MKTVIVLAMSVLASAQSSNIVEMLLPNINVEPYAASVVNEDTAATTYAVSCGSGTSDDCGGMPAFTAIQGSETAAYYYSLTASDVLVSYGCSVGGTTTAICSETVTGTGAEDPGASSFTLGPSDIAFMLVPVTVTAGSITQGASGAASSASTTSTASVASATSTVSTTSGDAQSSTATHTSSESSTATTTKSQQSSASTKSSTGGSMPLMTGNVQVAVGGAVLALVAAGI